MNVLNISEYKSNRTVKRCYNTIIELVEKYPVGKISVQMIADTAEISRFTFYKYFESKYDLIKYVFIHDTEETPIVIYENESSFLSSVSKYFQVLYDKRKYYQKISKEEGQECFKDFFIEYSLAVVTKNIINYYGEETYNKEGYAESIMICVSGMAYFTFEWMRCCCVSYTPKQMAEIFLKNLPLCLVIN